jgi:benzoylsuccinyl-CoA thiolase BbsB subunit
MRDVVIAGAGIVRFGSYPDTPHYVLATNALRNALADSGFSWKDVQAAFCGSVYQGTGSGHQALREFGLTGIPIINNENACSSSAVALNLGYQAISSGVYDIVCGYGI